jgi:hypothetical protein
MEEPEASTKASVGVLRNDARRRKGKKKITLAARWRFCKISRTDRSDLIRAAFLRAYGLFNMPLRPLLIHVPLLSVEA